MLLEILVVLVALALIAWVAAWMFAQKPVTDAQQLIQANRYAEALAAARPEDHLHRAEALKLIGRFDDAIAEYHRADDPAAREGIALSLAHLGRDLDTAKRLMEETIAATTTPTPIPSWPRRWCCSPRSPRPQATPRVPARCARKPRNGRLEVYGA